MKKILILIFSLFSIAAFSQATIDAQGKLIPTGAFPVAQTGDIKGSAKNVADLTARDAIPSSYREIGMRVYVATVAKDFQLQGGILNANWVDVTASGVSAGTNGNIATFYVNKKWTGIRGGSAWTTQNTAAEQGNSLKPYPDLWSARDAAWAYLAANPTSTATMVVMEGNEFTFGTSEQTVDYVITTAQGLKQYQPDKAAIHDAGSADLGINRMNWHFEPSTKITFKSNSQIGTNVANDIPALFSTLSSYSQAAVFNTSRTLDTFNITGNLSWYNIIDQTATTAQNNMALYYVGGDSSKVNIEISDLYSNNMFGNYNNGSGNFTVKNTNRVGIGFHNFSEMPYLTNNGVITSNPVIRKSKIYNYGNFTTGSSVLDGDTKFNVNASQVGVSLKRSPTNVSHTKNENITFNFANVRTQHAGKFATLGWLDSCNINYNIKNFYETRITADYGVDDASQYGVIPDFRIGDTIHNSVITINVEGEWNTQKSIVGISSLNFVNSTIIIDCSRARKYYNPLAPAIDGQTVNYEPMINISNWYADANSKIIIRGIYETDSTSVVHIQGAKNLGSIILEGTFSTKSNRYPAIQINVGGLTEANNVVTLRNCNLFTNHTSSLNLSSGGGTDTNIFVTNCLANKPFTFPATATALNIVGNTPNINPLFRF